MRKSTFSLILVALLAVSCHNKVVTDLSEGKTSGTERSTGYYANMFAYNIMSGYYLWVDQISDDLEKWPVETDPVAKVKSLRYKDAFGNEVDKWTELMEDCTPFLTSVTGNGKTFGFEFVLFYADETRTNIYAVVTFTYEGSPARKAGLKRGDVICAIDGETLNANNYISVLTDKVYDFPSTAEIGLADGRSMTMTAVQMYSDPVNVVKVIDKVGYIHFSSFTLNAAKSLVSTFLSLKAQGIEELVLDLRYNTGGYSATGLVMASMIAPIEYVRQEAVFTKSIYNDELSQILQTDESFSESFTIDDTMLNTADANLGLKRLWVITTGHSASASESLICGLKPYMDVILVGSTTYGKFCGGYLITADEWYKTLEESNVPNLNASDGRAKTAGWGIYVIASRYADCNGVTLSMPSGIPADYEAYDDLHDGYELGDPSESMLATVLSLINGGAPVKADAVRPVPQEIPYQKPGNFALLW